MYIILSFLLSILTCCIGINEMKKYESVNENIRKLIYLYPILLGVVFYRVGSNTFSLFFGSITPLLISHFIIDLKEQELPNLSNLIILVFAILRIVADLIIGGSTLDFLDFLTTGFSLFAIYLTIAFLTGGALGGGDIKLVGALGLFFPPVLLFKLLIYPIFLGSLIAIVLLVSKKGNKDTKFAFGPAIILAFYLISVI